MPRSSSAWLPQSANEWIASASMEDEPVIQAAVALATKIPKLADSAYSTARMEPPVDIGSFSRALTELILPAPIAFWLSGLMRAPVAAGALLIRASLGFTPERETGLATVRPAARASSTRACKSLPYGTSRETGT